MNTSDILYLAEQKLEKYGGWIQGDFAFNMTYANSSRAGIYVPPWHPDANCFCSIGAICNVITPASSTRQTKSDYANPTTVAYLLAAIGLTPIHPSAGESTIERWNDDDARTQPEILAAFQRARVLALDKESNELCP